MAKPLQAMFLFGLFLGSTVTYGQYRYFEYSNPAALVVDESVLQKLTAHQWYAIDKRFKVRADTFTYSGANIYYQVDGTFDGGTWRIERGRFIRHVRENARTNRGPDGLYGIIEITDTTLVIQKIQTSSRDMSITWYFSATPAENPRVFVQRPHGFIESTHIGPTATIFQRKSLTTQQLDSVRWLSSEGLFTGGFDYSRDSVFIHLQDTVYRIGRKFKE